MDLFAEDGEPSRVTAPAEALGVLLTAGDGGDDDGYATDQGTGVAGRPVVGLLFWVAADEVGVAATLAVDTATRAGAGCGAGPELYDVVVVPRSAVVLPRDASYPSMPD